MSEDQKDFLGDWLTEERREPERWWQRDDVLIGASVLTGMVAIVLSVVVLAEDWLLYW